MHSYLPLHEICKLPTVLVHSGLAAHHPLCEGYKCLAVSRQRHLAIVFTHLSMAADTFCRKILYLLTVTMKTMLQITININPAHCFIF